MSYPTDPLESPWRYDGTYQARHLALLDLIRIAAGGGGGGGGEPFENKLLQVDSIGTTTYLGYAEAGTLTSGATWAIKRIVETGNDVAITWADGNKSFDNTWNDRLTLTYS